MVGKVDASVGRLVWAKTYCYKILLIKIILLTITFTLLCNFCNFYNWNKSDDYSNDKDNLVIISCGGYCSTHPNSPFKIELLIPPVSGRVTCGQFTVEPHPRNGPLLKASVCPSLRLGLIQWPVNVGQKPRKLTLTWILKSQFQFKILPWN